MTEPDADLTHLLRIAASGDRRDLDRLMHAIYDDLRRIAVRHMDEERVDHTLQPTAVVHEAYMRLVDQRMTNWADRLHFFAVASQLIRRILVDHARSRGAAKRGGDRRRILLDPERHGAGGTDVDLLALDEAMADLSALDERQAQVVELRFFGGLTVPEIADLLSIGPRSVDRDWQCARAWLYDRLSGDAAPARESGDRGRTADPGDG